jgi:hypothetical protein
MISFSKSEVTNFRHTNKALRWGQQFYQHFKLNKITNAADKQFCDRLYNADEALAKQLVASRTDKGQ